MIAPPRRLTPGIIGSRRYSIGQSSVASRGGSLPACHRGEPELLPSLRALLGRRRASRKPLGADVEAVRASRRAAAQSQPVRRLRARTRREWRALLPAINIVKPSPRFSSAPSVSRLGRLRTSASAAEGGAHRVLQARHDPSLPEIVVHHEHAAGLEPAPHIVHRLLREQIAFEADVAVAAVQHQRVDQRVDDQVVLPGG